MKTINNHGFDPEEAKVLKTEQVFLYKPRSLEDWCYSHHPFITFYQGRFYAMWSNGKYHEDFPGQRVMYTSAEDFSCWAEPKPLMDTTKGDYVDVTLTACGFSHNGESLSAYVGQYEFDSSGLIPMGHAHYYHQQDYTQGTFPSRTHRNTRMLVLPYQRDGQFGTAINTGLPIVSNHPPQRLDSGRLLLSGNIMYPYTDDSSGIADWHIGGIYPPDLERDIYDDAEGLELVREKQGWTTHRCEGSFFQLPDSTINMLLRSGAENGSCVLYCTQSTDNGESWSQPVATEFTNDASKFHFGILPDGRYYYVGNPVLGSSRCPLVLSLSDNGVDFHQHYIIENRIYPRRFEGMFKGGAYGYPHTMVHQNKLYVIYSVNKEDVAVSQINIDSL